jgi:tetratricopeptide (TPR) repeat protein
MDDPEYFSNNPHVLGGFSWENVGWAFRTGHMGYWQPSVWLSYMGDVAMFGKESFGPHLINLLFHASNTVLLFLVILRMTGALWRSAFVAALFGLHPLRVESVAWVTERKDVLSAFFGFLTLYCYVRYVALDGDKMQWKLKKYLPVLIFFSLAVMSKPMLVTIPFIMLLLDYWPLGRFRLPLEKSIPHNLFRLVVEKLPLFVISAIFCVLTIYLQSKVGAVAAASGPRWGLRLQNAAVSFGRYLVTTFWPVDLACPYPFLPHFSHTAVVTSMLLILLLSLCACGFGRKFPWLFTGWFWFFGTMMPVIGLIQSGQQSMADRFTYVPSIGLFIVLVWSVSEMWQRWKLPNLMVIFIALLILMACAVETRSQLGYWQNSETLFKRALAVTKNNYIAHYNLGLAYFQQERVGEAIGEYQQALEINPDDPDTRNNLGTALLAQGRLDEAASQFQSVLLNNPKDTDSHVNLGNVYFQLGRTDEAIKNYEQALEIQPDIAEAHNNLASAFFQKGRQTEAVMHLQKALAINPHYGSAQENLAWVLATSSNPAIRNGLKALELAQEANKISSAENPATLRTLAAAYAESGNLPEAVAVAQKALQLATLQKNPQLAATIQIQLNFYTAGRAYHEDGVSK